MLAAETIGYLKNQHQRQMVRDAFARSAHRSGQGQARPAEDHVVSEMVAEGKIEIGMVNISQILTTPGVDLVGPRPPEIQSYIIFSGGMSTSRQP